MSEELDPRLSLDKSNADISHLSQGDMKEKQAKRRAMTQERAKHGLNLRSADTTAYLSNGDANPADYISEDFLQVLEVLFF